VLVGETRGFEWACEFGVEDLLEKGLEAAVVDENIVS